MDCAKKTYSRGSLQVYAALCTSCAECPEGSLRYTADASALGVAWPVGRLAGSSWVVVVVSGFARDRLSAATPCPLLTAD